MNFSSLPFTLGGLSHWSGLAYLVRMTETLAPAADASVTPLVLTEVAAARVRWIAQRHGPDALAALRLSVEGGGCSGFSYRFGLAETVEPDDHVVTTDGVQLVVDPVSFDLVAGCTVDFVQSMGGSAFTVTNPNAASGCGCGASFSV